MSYKLVVVSKKLNPPVSGRSWVEATCTFFSGNKPLIEDILVKSPVDSLQADLEDKCEELEKIAADFEAVPNGHEVKINKAAREQKRLEMRAKEKVEADKLQESMNNSTEKEVV